MQANAYIGDTTVLVEVGDLRKEDAADELFVRLNHGSGREEPGYRGRSLSVGDVVEIDGFALRCMPVGWQRVVWFDGDWMNEEMFLNIVGETLSQRSYEAVGYSRTEMTGEDIQAILHVLGHSMSNSERRRVNDEWAENIRHWKHELTLIREYVDDAMDEIDEPCYEDPIDQDWQFWEE